MSRLGLFDDSGDAADAFARRLALHDPVAAVSSAATFITPIAEAFSRAQDRPSVS